MTWFYSTTQGRLRGERAVALPGWCHGCGWSDAWRRRMPRSSRARGRTSRRSSKPPTATPSWYLLALSLHIHAFSSTSRLQIHHRIPFLLTNWIKLDRIKNFICTAPKFSSLAVLWAQKQWHARPPLPVRLGIVLVSGCRLTLIQRTGDDDENSWCTTPQPPVPVSFGWSTRLACVCFASWDRKSVV